MTCAQPCRTYNEEEPADVCYSVPPSWFGIDQSSTAVAAGSGVVVTRVTVPLLATNSSPLW